MPSPSLSFLIPVIVHTTGTSLITRIVTQVSTSHPTHSKTKPRRKVSQRWQGVPGIRLWACRIISFGTWIRMRSRAIWEIDRRKGGKLNRHLNCGDFLPYAMMNGIERRKWRWTSDVGQQDEGARGVTRANQLVVVTMAETSLITNFYHKCVFSYVDLFLVTSRRFCGRDANPSSSSADLWGQSCSAFVHGLRN